MPLPTKSMMHIDQFSTQIAIGYFLEDHMHICDAVPSVPVDKQSDKYPVFDISDLLRNQMQKRVRGGKSAEGGYRLSDGQYYCEPYSLHIPVAYGDYDNADNPLDPDKDAIAFLVQQAKIQMNESFVEKFMGPSIWTTDYDGVASNPSTNEVLQFDAASTDIIASISTLNTAVESSTGFRPNIGIPGAKVWDAINQDSTVVGRFVYTQTGIVTEDMAAALFGYKKLRVARSVHETAVEGQTSSPNYISGVDMVAMYVNENPSPSGRLPSAAYQFVWRRGMKVPNDQGIYMGRWDQRDRSAIIHEVDVAFDMKVTAPALGWFLDDAV